MATKPRSAGELFEEIEADKQLDRTLIEFNDHLRLAATRLRQEFAGHHDDLAHVFESLCLAKRKAIRMNTATQKRKAIRMNTATQNGN